MTAFLGPRTLERLTSPAGYLSVNAMHVQVIRKIVFMPVTVVQKMGAELT